MECNFMLTLFLCVLLPTSMPLRRLSVLDPEGRYQQEEQIYVYALTLNPLPAV